jgi:hypothetical protein
MRLSLYDCNKPEYQEKLKEMLNQISGFWFSSHAGFNASDKVEGYRDYTFGMKSGCSVTVNAIIHDLAHVVEFGPENFRKNFRYGRLLFKIPKPVCVNGILCYDFFKDTATLRECRTMGIEYSLSQSLGFNVCTLDDFIGEAIDTLRYMPDHCNQDKDRMRDVITQYTEVYTIEQINERINAWLDKVVGCLKRRKLPLFNFREVIIR